MLFVIILVVLRRKVLSTVNIEVGSVYVSRNGDYYRIHITNRDHPDYPVLGRFANNDKSLLSWTTGGEYLKLSPGHPKDLIREATDLEKALFA